MGLIRLSLALLSLVVLASAGGGGGGTGCTRRLAGAEETDEAGEASSRRRSTTAIAADEPWCGEYWWEEEHEYAYVESYMVVSLVGLALLFETIHHVAQHRSLRAYVFGRAWDERRHEESHDEAQHSLLADLTSRSTSEFTVLGFLAFVIWCVSRLGGFDDIASYLGPGEEGFRLPRSGYEYLHMLEDVHMHLFVGMVFYFSFMYQLVLAMFRTMQGWEARDIACGLRDLEADVDAPDSRGSLGPVPGHPRFSSWRKFFFASLVRCKDEFPTGWAELERFCEWKESRHKMQTTSITAAREPQKQKIHTDLTADMDEMMKSQARRAVLCLDDWFPFGKFLAMNSRVVIEDMIDFSPTTWLATALLMICSGFLARFISASFQQMMPFYVGFTILVFAAICVLLHSWERHIGEIHAWRTCLNSFHRKVPIEVLLIRLLQVLLFYVSYATSRMVASGDDWKYHFWENVSFTVVFLLFHLALRLGVADIIVHFAGLTCVGEFMSEADFARLLKILEKRQDGYGQAQLARLDAHVNLSNQAHVSASLKPEPYRDSHTCGDASSHPVEQVTPEAELQAENEIE